MLCCFFKFSNFSIGCQYEKIRHILHKNTEFWLFLKGDQLWLRSYCLFFFSWDVLSCFLVHTCPTSFMHVTCLVPTLIPCALHGHRTIARACFLFGTSCLPSFAWLTIALLPIRAPAEHLPGSLAEWPDCFCNLDFPLMLFHLMVNLRGGLVKVLYPRRKKNFITIMFEFLSIRSVTDF